ncbi:hypothetical protein CPB83DRAFT_831936 [Crepidotus variabilis]|uniref:Uncharacterized protein n=1 Tax=Crepidotus variabilis TaxID=179855 RepID=A0A9P6EQL8_9AGAR|nr:hypothetical protein CPB83DRAFT_831936 [Crepidotus variabilis]
MRVRFMIIPDPSRRVERKQTKKRSFWSLTSAAFQYEFFCQPVDGLEGSTPVGNVATDTHTLVERMLKALRRKAKWMAFFGTWAYSIRRLTILELVELSFEFEADNKNLDKEYMKRLNDIFVVIVLN